MSRNKINLKIFILFLINMNLCLGQVGGVNAPINDYFPSSPNAASMTNYGISDIGEFTGTMEHSIELYKINYDEIEIPISLNYSSNGVNVNKFESVVGIDWSLNWGGVITRTVNGLPDEISCLNEFPPPPYDSDIVNHPVFTSIIFGNCTDIQPDIFHLNIAGYSTSFYIKNANTSDRKVVMIDPSPIKIEILEGFFLEQPKADHDFKVTTPAGKIYYFGGNYGSDRAHSKSYKENQTGYWSQYYKSAMYLSRIESPDGKFMEFNYFNKNFDRIVGVSQSMSAKWENGIYHSVELNNHEPYRTRNMGEEAFISSISWSGNTVHFNYEQKLLRSIQVKNSNNKPIKKFNLEYYSFNSDSSFAIPDYCSDCDSNTVRYFLEKIKEKGSDDDPQEKVTKFEYYDPEDLPPRLSYSIDYWGYFNGENNSYLVSKDVSNYHEFKYPSTGGDYFNTQVIHNMFNKGANRNTNPDYAIKGLLKEIIYPTGGKTEIEYEANSHRSEVEYENDEVVVLEARTDGTWTASDDFTFTSQVNQKVNINSLTLSFRPEHETDYGEPCNINNYPPHHIRGSLYVINSNGDNIPIYFDSPNGGYQFEFSNSISIGNSDWNPNEDPYPPPKTRDDLYFFADEGEEYTIKVSLIHPCLRIVAAFNYITDIEYISEEIPYGGMRVKSVINKTDDEAASKIRFFYGKFDNFQETYAVFQPLEPQFSFFYKETQSGLEVTATLGASTMNDLYFSSRNPAPIAYPYVTKAFFDKNGNSNGYVQRQYDIVFDEQPDRIYNDWVPGTPSENQFGNGNLLFEFIKDNQGEMLKKSTYHYKKDDYDFDSFVYGYNISLGSKIETSSPSTPLIIYDVNINRYRVNTHRDYIEWMQVEEFNDGEEPIKKRIEYYYDGANKLLLSKESFKDSNDRLNETIYKYPEDLIYMPHMDEFISTNRIGIPIKTTTIVGGETVKQELTKYDNFGSKLFPSEVFIKKGSENITEGDLKITYKSYDEKGNLTEYILESGIPVSIIWGYNNQYPIAKVEGAEYYVLEEPYDYVEPLVTLSDSGDLDAGAFENLRNIEGVMVTGYIYEPLVGVTTIIQPNGQMETYEYDDAGRLKYVKDHNGNIIRKIEYNYQNQQP